MLAILTQTVLALQFITWEYLLPSPHLAKYIIGLRLMPNAPSIIRDWYKSSPYPLNFPATEPCRIYLSS
jgi:hypothetical protein